MDLGEKFPDLENRDGLWWYEAPLPTRFHRCRAWTTQWIGETKRIQRCSCGSVRMGLGRWMEKNSRRRFRRGVRY